jgi:hypothetical protein
VAVVATEETAADGCHRVVATQCPRRQLGDGLYTDFRQAFGIERSRRPPWILSLATSQLEEAGLEVARSGEGEQIVTFRDTGALAWYLKMVPWTVPGFSISTHRDRLFQLHERLRSEGPLRFRLPAFYVETVKP